LEFLTSSNGFILSQHRYILDILNRTKMIEAKPINCPMASSTLLSAFEGDLFSDPTLFRSTIGALQYLCITRLDISFCVNKLAQFMHNPTDLHWQAVKRLLRYLKETVQYGLHFHRAPTSSMKHTLTQTGQETSHHGWLLYFSWKKSNFMELSKTTHCCTL